MSYSERPQFAFPELTPAIKRLLLINAGVFVLNMLVMGNLSQGGAWFAFSWEKATEGYGLGMVRLITYQFTHDWQSLGHIFWNMLTLYFFGTMAERSLGYRGVFKLYLLSGIVAALAHLAVASLQGYENVPLVGASGACYAFLIYAACMAPRSTVLLLFIPVPLGLLAGALVFMGLYSSYVEFVQGFPGGVAHSAHLGGAAFGFLAWRLGWFRDYTPYVYQQGLLAGYKQKWRQWRDKQKSESEAANQAEIDRILEKVHQEGLKSLTSAERRVLERQSQRNRKS